MTTTASCSTMDSSRRRCAPNGTGTPSIASVIATRMPPILAMARGGPIGQPETEARSTDAPPPFRNASRSRRVIGRAARAGSGRLVRRLADRGAGFATWRLRSYCPCMASSTILRPRISQRRPFSARSWSRSHGQRLTSGAMSLSFTRQLTRRRRSGRVARDHRQRDRLTLKSGPTWPR